jgi:hypothetical protein
MTYGTKLRIHNFQAKHGIHSQRKGFDFVGVLFAGVLAFLLVAVVSDYAKAQMLLHDSKADNHRIVQLVQQ